MDAKFLLGVLFAAFVAVSCKPTGSSNDELFNQMKRTLNLLKDQVEHLKDAEIKREASDLADAKLQDSTSKDAVLKRKATDLADAKLQDSEDLEASLKKAVEADKDNDNTDVLMDYDFDEYDEAAKKKKGKKDAPKAGGPILAHDEEIVKPQIMNDDKPAVGGPHLDKPVNDEPKVEIFDEEVTGLIQGIKKDIKGIAADFKDVKRDYIKLSNMNKMSDDTTKKYELVKSDIKSVLSEFKDIKAEYGSGNAKREVHQENKDELKDMLNDMKAQLGSVTANLKDVKDYAKEMKDEDKSQFHGPPPAPVKKDQKPKKDEEVQDEIEHLHALEDEVKDILQNTKEIKDDIMKAKNTPSQDEVIQASSGKLEDMENELAMISDEIKLLRDPKQ